MIRVFLYFLLVALAAAAGVWLVERPGAVSVEWIGYRMETSVIVAGLTLVILIALLFSAWRIAAGLWRAPSALRRAFREAERRRRDRIILEGLLAVAAGDHARGRRLAAEARRTAPDQPLALLLEAQAAQIDGRIERANDIFRMMLRMPETRLLGVRGLFVSARRANDLEAARRLAQEAFDVAPTAAWASRALLELHAVKRDWTGALATLAHLEREGVFDRDAIARQRSVLLTAQAIEREAKDPAAAAALAEEALRAAPDLVPAAVIAARRASETGEIKQAVKILERTWKHEPHPDLAQLYAHVRPGDGAQDRLVRIQRLVRIRANHEEGLVALARAAVEAREWRMAREALAPLLRGRPQARVCALMAEVELEERGDQGRAREWLSRALRASPDPAWTADGWVSAKWLPVSPVTGALDVFRWKVPVEAVGGRAIEAERERLAAEALNVPPPSARAAAEAKFEDAETVVSAPPPEPEAARAPEPPPPGLPRLEPVKPADNAPRPAPRPPSAVVTPLPLPTPPAEAVTQVDEDQPRSRRPDDPGVADDMGPAARKFGIF